MSNQPTLDSDVQPLTNLEQPIQDLCPGEADDVTGGGQLRPKRMEAEVTDETDAKPMETIAFPFGKIGTH